MWSKKLKHDSLVKIIMTDKIAAQEFLEYYLPEDFKKLMDLSKITVEQESYIEESLSKKYSDIVYGIDLHLPTFHLSYLINIYHRNTRITL